MSAVPYEDQPSNCNNEQQNANEKGNNLASLHVEEALPATAHRQAICGEGLPLRLVSEGSMVDWSTNERKTNKETHGNPQEAMEILIEIVDGKLGKKKANKTGRRE